MRTAHGGAHADCGKKGSRLRCWNYWLTLCGESARLSELSVACTGGARPRLQFMPNAANISPDCFLDAQCPNPRKDGC